MQSNIPITTVNEPFDAAVLICHLLAKFGTLSEDEIVETLTLDEMVKAFTISDALSIIENKHLADVSKKDGVSCYDITVDGGVIASEFKNTVPFTVRQKCCDEIKRILQMKGLKKAFVWKIDKISDGYSFSIRFLNEMGGTDIADIKIYNPTYESASAMQEKFLEKPIETIERIMFLFT